MTISSFGQIMPLQGYMLQLAGYGPSDRTGARDMELPAALEDRVENVLAGQSHLLKITDYDHGILLSKWHKALLEDPKLSSQYCFVRTWPLVEQAILAQIENPERAQLEALISNIK